MYEIQILDGNTWRSREFPALQTDSKDYAIASCKEMVIINQCVEQPQRVIIMQTGEAIFYSFFCNSINIRI